MPLPHARAPMLAVLLCLAGVAAQAQDQPSFDCAKASSRVEHVLCAGESEMGWLDHSMADLYRALLQRNPERAAAPGPMRR